MRISEVIEIVDRQYPNYYTYADKVRWLSKLDGLIRSDIHGDNSEFNGYEEDAELVVPFPYAEDVYKNYMLAQIDKENGEIDRYNQNITMYNNAIATYESAYIRSHGSTTKRFIF